jgi:hypothetical protein
MERVSVVIGNWNAGAAIDRGPARLLTRSLPISTRPREASQPGTSLRALASDGRSPSLAGSPTE